MKITQSQLNELRKQLNKGGLNEISKRSGMSYQVVLDVFNGKYQNFKVIETIIEVAKEHKEKRMQLQTEIIEILNENPKNMINILETQRQKYGENVSPLL